MRHQQRFVLVLVPVVGVLSAMAMDCDRCAKPRPPAAPTTSSEQGDQKVTDSTSTTAPFRVVLVEGGLQSGYEILEVDSVGRCKYTFPEHIPPPPATPDAPVQLRWRRATFAIDPETRDALRREIISSGVEAMNTMIGGSVADGTQWLVKLAFGNRRKMVYFDNQLPDSVRRLFNFAKTRILARNKSALEQADIAEMPPERVAKLFQDPLP